MTLRSEFSVSNLSFKITAIFLHNCLRLIFIQHTSEVTQFKQQQMLTTAYFKPMLACKDPKRGYSIIWLNECKNKFKNHAV